MSEVLMGFEKTSSVPVKGAKILTTPDDVINGAHEDVFPIIVLIEREKEKVAYNKGRSFLEMGWLL